MWRQEYAIYAGNNTYLECIRRTGSMVLIYTGNGKGKTTAALGLGLRAVGHGIRVIMIQFMKGQITYGEIEAVKKLPLFCIEQYGRPDFVNPEKPEDIDIKLAKDALRRAEDIIENKTYDMVILDEINVAIEYGLIPLGDVISLIKRIPETMHLVLTGRYMPEELLEHADMVSEVREIKHHFEKGKTAQEGIEF
jgi:cob(I)alamin adenosyltransferase